MIREWLVLEEDLGKKLQVFLFEKLKGAYSLRSIKRLIEANQCQVNQRVERFAATFVGTGDVISLRIPDASLQASSKALSQASFKTSSKTAPVPPLFEDEWLCIYPKPPGLSCDSEALKKLDPSSSHSWSLVHRLDKETSGALLVAKEPRVLALLISAFKEFRVNKRYLAIVEGAVSVCRGKIENYLGKKTVFSGQTMWGAVSQGARGERLFASTEWERWAINAQMPASLLACFPKTGRTHQIRVHLAEMGHPILGDFQYGRHFRCSFHPPRMLLHAEHLSFIHPITQKSVEVLAPLPEDFKQGLAACKF